MPHAALRIRTATLPTFSILTEHFCLVNCARFRRADEPKHRFMSAMTGCTEVISVTGIGEMDSPGTHGGSHSRRYSLTKATGTQVWWQSREALGREVRGLDTDTRSMFLNSMPIITWGQLVRGAASSGVRYLGSEGWFPRPP